MKSIRRNVLFVALVALTSILGCMGGGGGSSAPVVKDVAGINATISGFMQSIVAKDPSAAGEFMAQTTSEETTHVHTLMVYDFGHDIYDPNDERNHYPFRVNEADIEQPTDTIATVKAYYNLSSGQPLWLTFTLVKENGIWMIETMVMGDTSSSGPTSLQASTYFPITPGANYKMAAFYLNELEPYPYVFSFSSTPYTVDGMNFYEMIDQEPLVSRRNLRAQGLRASSAPPFLDPDGGNMYYSLQDSGLYAYSSSVNQGVPFKVLEAYHEYNSEFTFGVAWQDLNNQTVVGTCTLSIGGPTSLETGLQTYSAVPLTYTTVFPSSSGEITQKWTLWLAPGVGIVGTDEYDTVDQTSPTYFERIVERTVNGVTTTNNPSITTASVADVTVGTAMTPVTFQVTGGIAPHGWDLVSANWPTGEFSFGVEGVLTGTPSTTGSYSFSVMVKDKYGRTDSKTLTINVVEPSPISPAQYSVLDSGDDIIAMGSHYEKFYYVEPSGATTITDVRVVSYSPQQSIYPPWTGFDSFYNEWMLSFTPENPGTYVFAIEVTTADGATHQFEHNLTVTESTGI